MKSPEFLNNNQTEISESEKTRYESALWQKAEELSSNRIELEEKSKTLYDALNNKKSDADSMDKEKNYWQAEKKLNTIKEQEDIIQKLLERLTDGLIEKEEIEEILSSYQKESEKPKESKESKNEENALSKKKQRILEEKEKTGIDPRGDQFSSKEFGQEKMRLTTGRRAKSIKNIDTQNALNEFIYRTSDTHGGKGAIKKGDTYISKSGKKIRKK
ncbi:MAG: hypothetical protein AAB596_01270 [Patescibacteria group bacterium]